MKRLTIRGFNYKSPELQKLCQLEDIEEETGIDLIALFSVEYERSFDLDVRKDEIYFDGDSYYGYWNKEQWICFIEDVISAYRELIKLGN